MSASSNPQKKQKASCPPKRGQIKAQIFENLAETVSSLTSKAVELAMSKLKGSVDAGVRSSASTTPPPSSYTSDGSPSHA